MKFINESTDLPEYYNREYWTAAEQIATAILYEMNYGDFDKDAFVVQRTYKDGKIINSEHDSFCLLTTDNTKLDWLDNIDILITTGNKFGTDNDYFVLMDTAVYKAIEFGIDTENYELYFQKSPIEFLISYNGSEEIPYIRSKDGKSIKKATLVFIIPDYKTISSKELKFIIMHEIQHLHDIFFKNLSMEQLNKDIIFNSSKKFLISLNDRKVISGLLNSNINNIQLIKYSLEPQTIMKLFIEYNSLFNLSEMWSRLYNIRGEIDDINPDLLYGDLLFDESRKILKSNSDIYFDYCVLYDLFNDFIKYYPSELKNEFAQKYIKNWFAQKNPDGEFIYGSDFRYNNQYNSKSFDMFFEYHLNNINNIIFIQSHKILREVQKEKMSLQQPIEEHFMKTKHIDRHIWSVEQKQYKSRILEFFDI